MTKKGKLEEIFSKAKYADDPFSYEIIYRDFEHLKHMSLPDFLKESGNFEIIPASRIQIVKKKNKILFEKNKTVSEK